jgi:hypothetical protein
MGEEKYKHQRESRMKIKTGRNKPGENQFLVVNVYSVSICCNVFRTMANAMGT